MKFSLAAITWPMAAVLVAGGAIFTIVLLYAPPEAQHWLFGANGFICALVASFLKPPQSLDEKPVVVPAATVGQPAVVAVAPVQEVIHADPTVTQTMPAMTSPEPKEPA